MVDSSPWSCKYQLARWTHVAAVPRRLLGRVARFQGKTLHFGEPPTASHVVGLQAGIVESDPYGNPQYTDLFFRWEPTVAASVIVGNEGAYGGVAFRPSFIKRIGGPENGPLMPLFRTSMIRRDSVRDFLLGNTFGAGPRFHAATGSNWNEAAAIAHFGVSAVAGNQLVGWNLWWWRIPSLLGVAAPELGVRLRSFGSPRGSLAWNLPFTVRDPVGIEFGLTTFYLPADPSMLAFTSESCANAGRWQRTAGRRTVA